MAGNDVAGTSLDGAWNAPIFRGEMPRTFQALHDECDEFLRTINQLWFGSPAAMGLVARWNTAMGRLSAAEQPPMPDIVITPRPADGRIGATRGVAGPGAHVAISAGVHVERLRNHAIAVRDWCKARMAEVALTAALAATKPDKKRHERKKYSKKRPITAAAARCADLFKKAKRKDPSTRMKHIVEDYAVEHDCSGQSIMRVLNDHPELWKEEKDDKKATEKRH